MNTCEFIHARLKESLPHGNAVPPFTAKELLFCEAIDRLAGISIKQSRLEPHDFTVFNERLKP